MDLRLANDTISPERATDLLLEYARRFAETLRYYDYAEHWPNLPEPEDGFSLADIGRLVVINGRPSSSDVVALLTPLASPLWADVPKTANFLDLPENPLGNSVYEAADRLYLALRSWKGLGSTKVTKALHLKRPLLFPIIDSVVKKQYTGIATGLAREYGAPHPMIWCSVWADARANSKQLEEIREDLRAHKHGELIADLPLLRLHDVLVWMRFNGGE